MKGHGDGQIEKNFHTCQEKPPGPLLTLKPLFDVAINLKRMKSDSLSA
jgi:hypothetical protein